MDEQRAQQIKNTVTKSQSRITFDAVMADGVNTMPYFDSTTQGGAYQAENPPTNYNKNVGTRISVGTTPATISSSQHVIARVGDVVYQLNGTTTDFSSYDLATEGWTLRTSCPVAMAYCSPIVSGTDILFLTYHNGTTHVTDAPYKYDTVGHSWTPLTTPTTPPASAILYVWEVDPDNPDKVYGLQASSTNTFIYTKSTNTYTTGIALTETFVANSIVIHGGYIYYLVSTVGLVRYKISDGSSEFISYMYSTTQSYSATLFLDGDMLYASSHGNAVPKVINLTTYIEQYAFFGESRGLASSTVAKSVFRYGNYLYSFNPIYIYTRVAVSNNSNEILRYDMTFPHFYNLHKG